MARLWMSIPTSRNSVQQLNAWFLARLEKEAYPRAVESTVLLGFTEAVTNACEHGNNWNDGTRIYVHCELRRDRVVIEVSDEGQGFNPKLLLDPTSASRLTCPHGRGVFLMQSMFDEMAFLDSGTRVRLVMHVLPKRLRKRSAVRRPGPNPGPGACADAGPDGHATVRATA